MQSLDNDQRAGHAESNFPASSSAARYRTMSLKDIIFVRINAKPEILQSDHTKSGRNAIFSPRLGHYGGLLGRRAHPRNRDRPKTQTRHQENDGSECGGKGGGRGGSSEGGGGCSGLNSELLR
jgi:hypothetical protein